MSKPQDLEERLYRALNMKPKKKKPEPPQRPYLVDVEQRVVSKYATGGGYWIQSFAFAERTLTEARRDGALRARFFAMSLGVETRFVVNQACDRCGITGVEPGCKCKSCSTCGGTARLGRVDLESEGASR